MLGASCAALLYCLPNAKKYKSIGEGISGLQLLSFDTSMYCNVNVVLYVATLGVFGFAFPVPVRECVLVCLCDVVLFFGIVLVFDV